MDPVDRNLRNSIYYQQQVQIVEGQPSGERTCITKTYQMCGEWR